MKRLAAFGALVVALATARQTSAAEAGASIVLDVPYVAQSGDLCGGAAAAMVMRYWGARGVNAESFAGLATSTNRGIATQALVESLVSQGWHAYALTGTAGVVRHHLAAGRPLVALIRVAPSRWHYVVIVAWTTDRVVYHDPAVLPLRSMSSADFDRAWSDTKRWMLLVLPVLPPKAGVAVVKAEAEIAGPPTVCEAQVARGITLTHEEQLADAALVLKAAHGSCPESAVPLRELAGVQLLQSDYSGAETSAMQAIERDPHDHHAWRLLATTRFLRQEDEAALDAWNQAGEPVIDLVRADGLVRTSQAAIERTIGAAPGSVLTGAALAIGRRRLGDLPAAGASRLDYVPIAASQTELHASVAESSLFPAAWPDFAGIGLHAAIDREVQWTFASPARHGEAITASWRWWDTRPRLALTAEIPVSTGFNGVLTLEGVTATETFAVTGAGEITESSRHTFHVGYDSWATPWLRWNTTAGADWWDGLGSWPAIGGGVDVRLASDHVALAVDGTMWPGRSHFGTLDGSLRWRSRTAGEGAFTMMALDSVVAGDLAPRDLWPGADTGLARPFLLRAHPLLDDGVIAGEAFGRRLAHGSGEWQSAARSALLVRLRAAFFVDAARAWHGDVVRDRTLVDVGSGVRVGLPGEGTIRIDYAHGITDGANALSVGWEPRWPHQR